MTSALVRALASGDADLMAAAVQRLRELATRSDRVRYAAGLGGLLLHDVTGDGQALDQAIADLEDTRAASAAGCGPASDGELMRSLHRAYRHRRAGPEDLQAATDAGLAALAEDVGAVLLRYGAADGLRAARRVGDFAHGLALDCLAQENPEAAITALELGRGLILQTATATAGLPELLDRAGSPDLAAHWLAAAPVDPPAPDAETLLLRALDPDLSEGVSNLRSRTLDALADTPMGRILHATCDTGAVAAALQATGRDALVYLLGGDAHRAGWALIVTAAGGLRSIELPGLRPGTGGPLDAWLAAPVDPGTLDEVCRWAGLSVLAPVLARLPAEPRITLVPCGPLAAVPWHAAHLRPAAGPRACELATFSRTTTGQQFVDLAHAQPKAGGPVVLSTGRTEDGATVADAVIAAGATGVIAALWPTPDLTITVLMHVLHDHLQQGDPPDVALAAAQRWMLAPYRQVPDGLAETARPTDLTDPTAWAAFTYQG